MSVTLPRTKIVATIGPACWEESTLLALLQAGVSVVRFNFSHAEHASTAAKIALVRRLSNELSANVAVLADLQGPRIRVGLLPANGVTLTSGSRVTLAARTGQNSDAIPVDYAELAGDVEPGDTLLLDDGLIVMQVEDTDPASGRIECRVIAGGLLTSHKGINVPGRPLSVPAVTEKDRADLKFALEQGADTIALSFVRSAGDVEEARRLIEEQTERGVPIIAKIEKGAAVTNFAEILAAADGIMVARGDLGVEVPAETLPGIQKRLIAAANRAGKPVITATQMLDSMIRNPRPTRAEATDVANAVLDGSDGIMLSGETAVGKYPVESVQTMARIALEAENLFDYEGWGERIASLADRLPALLPEESSSSSMLSVTQVVCEAADRIAERMKAQAIIALTRSGTTARFVAKYRPRSILLAVTDRPATRRALAVSWGVQALLLPRFGETLDTLNAAEELAREGGFITDGDLLVFVSGLPEPQPGQTSLLKVQIAGEVSGSWPSMSDNEQDKGGTDAEDRDRA